MLRSNDPFIRQVTQERASKFGNTGFSKLWYSDLSPLDASGVAVLRYVQAERQISQLISERIAIKGKRIAAREAIALPSFEFSELPKDVRVRATKLLNIYRRELLLEPQFQNRTKGKELPSDRTLEKVLDRSFEFLGKLDDRKIGDDHGDVHSLGRTLYLLDVIPEHRLSIRSSVSLLAKRSV